MRASRLVNLRRNHGTHPSQLDQLRASSLPYSSTSDPTIRPRDHTTFLSSRSSLVFSLAPRYENPAGRPERQSRLPARLLCVRSELYSFLHADPRPRLPQIPKPTHIQTFVAKLPVEALHVRDFHWLSRLDISQLEFPIDTPTQEVPRSKFAALSIRRRFGRPRDKMRNSRL